MQGTVDGIGWNLMGCCNIVKRALLRVLYVALGLLALVIGVNTHFQIFSFADVVRLVTKQLFSMVEISAASVQNVWLMFAMWIKSFAAAADAAIPPPTSTDPLFSPNVVYPSPWAHLSRLAQPNSDAPL
eukprot:SAG11_NODE_56_length_19295_cov_20.219675_22_plen_129_part_00